MAAMGEANALLPTHVLTPDSRSGGRQGLDIRGSSEESSIIMT